MTCQHDPMFTTDGRCSKCYPPRSWRDVINERMGRDKDCTDPWIVMVQHDGGAQEVHPGWLDMQHVTNERARQLADEQRAQFIDWQHSERGMGCAGNSADEYDSNTEGHW